MLRSVRRRKVVKVVLGRSPRAYSTDNLGTHHLAVGAEAAMPWTDSDILLSQLIVKLLQVGLRSIVIAIRIEGDSIPHLVALRLGTDVKQYFMVYGNSWELHFDLQLLPPQSGTYHRWHFFDPLFSQSTLPLQV